MSRTRGGHVLFPRLDSTRIRLTPVHAGDGSRAYEILLRAGAGTLPPLDAFLAGFGQGGRVRFIAEPKEGGEPVALVVLRDRDTAGHVHADVHVDAAQAGTGSGAETAMLA